MIGFIGLGVMGEPICRNLAKKSGQKIIAYDLSPEPLARLADAGVQAAGSVRDVAEKADYIFLSLPGGKEVKHVCAGPGGSLMLRAKSNAYIVDLSTTPVALAREMYDRFHARGIHFADAPVARTREAAEKGTLSIMVGGPEATFKRVKPLLVHIGTDVMHCGAAGAGQALKLINNMMLFQNVLAVAEGLGLAKRIGIDLDLALAVLTKGSADSFALRNHGVKAIMAGDFPERAYSVDYARKDLAYVLELARQAKMELPGAQNVGAILDKAAEAGLDKNYFPVIAKLINPE
jgi:3-hydroxyisobutyrate dehydrogenase-like beta-hydroxyacid dehydrogenase